MNAPDELRYSSPLQQETPTSQLAFKNSVCIAYGTALNPDEPFYDTPHHVGGGGTEPDELEYDYVRNFKF